MNKEIKGSYETMDDYEEGIITPPMVVGYECFGRYTKIGKMTKFTIRYNPTPLVDESFKDSVFYKMFLFFKKLGL